MVNNLLVINYFIIGTTLCIFLRWEGLDELRWKDLAAAAFLGLFWPMIVVSIVFTILVRAEFWDRPIFGRKCARGP